MYICFLVFSSSWKEKKKKKKSVQNLKWATTHLSIRLGAQGRWERGAGALGARRRGTRRRAGHDKQVRRGRTGA